MSDPPVLLPLFLDVSGKNVLVVGGGEVAARKAQDLVAANARVCVVAPDVVAAIEELGEASALVVERRRFEDVDVTDVWLVIAATDDEEVQRRVARAAERERVFCVAVDDPANATAYGGAVVRRGPVTIAISTSGEAPALSRLLREVIEQTLPDSNFVETARALREKWKAEGTPMKSRFAELVKALKEKAG
jgi:siroheme synthase-like protein